MITIPVVILVALVVWALIQPDSQWEMERLENQEPGPDATAEEQDAWLRQVRAAIEKRRVEAEFKEAQLKDVDRGRKGRP